MELKRTADIHEQLSQSGPAKHERKKNIVTTPEEYDQFFDGYDAQVNQILKNLPEDVSALGPDVSLTEAEGIATKKAEDFSHFLDRIVTIGEETEKALADFENVLALDDRDKIEQHINSCYLIMSVCNTYHQKFYKEASPSMFTDAQKDTYQLTNKRMREALFNHSLTALTKYLEDAQKQTIKEKKGDAQVKKEHAKTILKKLVDIATQAQPIDLDRCHDLLAFAKNNQTIMRDLVPDGYQTTLYTLAERVIKAGHVTDQARQNGSPPEGIAAGIADSKRVRECATLFVPLLKQEVESAITLNDLSSWHKLDIAQTNARPNTVAPPSYLKKLSDLAKDRTNHLLQEKGLDDEILKAWQISQKPEDRGEYYADNFQVIEELEKTAPGAAKALNKEFGIQNFARQSLAFWIKQYEERDNHTTPYGVLLSPADDWNGAFSNGSLAYSVDRAVEQMNGKALFRVLECRNKIDALRKLLDMKRRYQAPKGGHQISFAIIAGHGTENSIRIGRPEAPPKTIADEAPPLYEGEVLPPPLNEEAPPDIDLITPADILNPGTQKIKKLFREDAPIVLLSCSTGKAGGIGETMSNTYDADVAAPTVDTDGETWTFQVSSEGKVEIKTIFSSKERGAHPANTAFYERNRSSEPPPL